MKRYVTNPKDRQELIVRDWYLSGIYLKEITQHRRDIRVKFLPYLVKLFLKKYQFQDEIVVATKNAKSYNHS